MDIFRTMELRQRDVSRAYWQESDALEWQRVLKSYGVRVRVSCLKRRAQACWYCKATLRDADFPLWKVREIEAQLPKATADY